MANEQQQAAEGLANLAHAVRRSTALYVAMQISPPDSTIPQMLDTADVLANWLRGSAGASTPTPMGPPPGGEFLGENPWDRRD